MSSRYTLLWNSLTGTALYALGGAVSFLMAPFLVHHLTNGGYGFWELLMGMAGYLGILDLGISPAVMRYVALARGENNQARLVQVINTGFMAFLLAGLTGAAIMGLVAFKPTLIFGAMPIPLSEGRLLVCLGALLLLISFVRTTFTAALLGLQLHRMLNGIRAGMSLVQAGSVYFLLTHDNTHALLKVAAVTVSTASLECLACAFMLIRVLGHLVSPRHAKWADTKQLLGFGAKSMGIMASSSLMRQGMLFVISHSIGPAQVTFYVLSTRLIDYGAALGSAVGYPITPYLSSALGKEGVHGAAQAFHFTTRAMTFICAGLAMGVFWLGLPFLARWMGPEYAHKGMVVFYILATGTFIQTLGVNAARMLFSLNQHGRVAIGGLFFACVAFVTALVTVPIFGLAAAAACLSVYVTGLNIWELWLVARALKFSFWHHVLDTVKRVVPPIAAGSLVLALLAKYLPATSYAQLFVHVIAGGLAYTGVSYWSMLDAPERARLIVAIRQRMTGQSPVAASASAPI